MIKIIKDGQKDFIAKCSTCGCEFSYQLVDIGLNSVVCPCCGHYVAHKEFEEPSLATGTHAIPCKFTQQTTANWIAPDVTITSSNTDSQFDSLQRIRDLCVDYDGFNTVEGLKSLVDDIREIAEQKQRTFLENTAETREYLESLPKIYMVAKWAGCGVREFPFAGKCDDEGIPFVYDYDDCNGTCDRYFLRKLTDTTTGWIYAWTTSERRAKEIAAALNEVAGESWRND